MGVSTNLIRQRTLASSTVASARLVVTLQAARPMFPTILVYLLGALPHSTAGLVAATVMVDLALLGAATPVDQPGYPTVGLAFLGHREAARLVRHVTPR